MNRRTNKLARILFNTLTAMSSVLCITAAMLWIVSCFVTRQLVGEDANLHLVVANVPQGLSMRIYEIDPFAVSLDRDSVRVARRFHWSVSATDSAEWTIDDVPGDDRRSFHSFLGIVYASLDAMEVDFFRASAIRIPHAWLIVTFGLLPLMWIRSRVQSKRHRPGHCPACGYDIRANPAKCSECGHEIAAPRD